MAMVKPSSKHQIVIPRAIREKLGIEPGTPVYIDMVGTKEARISTKSVLERYAATMPGVWGDDPAAAIRRDREAWDGRLDLDS
jgi:AbrB family looped-hinge helix DNA binding protein